MKSRIGFLGICLGYFAVILDGSVLNVGIPDIRHDMAASMADAQWTVNGYTLVLAALLLSGGTFGDRFGLKRTLLVGLGVFTLASAWCSAADSPAMLILARAVQGLGAAALLPATLGLIPHVFPDRALREKAAVVWVATSAIAVSVGPLVGGLLIDAFGWRSIFLINIPVCAAAALVVWRCVSDTPRRSTPIDYPGQVLAVATLGLLTGGIVAAGSRGWGAPTTWGLIVAGAACGAAFLLTESRTSHPLLPLSFFAHKVRSAAVVALGATGFLFYGALFVMSLYFQQELGWSSGRTGVALLPLTVGTVLAPLVLYGPLSRKFGHPMMMLVGFTGFLIGTIELLWGGGGATYAWIAVGLFALGVASTFVPSAAASIVVLTMDGGHGGLASGVQNTLRQTGGLLSVAVFGSLLNSSDFMGRLRVVLMVMAVCEVLGVLGSTAVLRIARTSKAAPEQDDPSSDPAPLEGQVAETG